MRQLRVRVCSERWCGDWESVWRHFQRALWEGPTPGQECQGSTTKEMINPALVPVTAATDFSVGKFANLTPSPLYTWMGFGSRCLGGQRLGMVLGVTQSPWSEKERQKCCGKSSSAAWFQPYLCTFSLPAQTQRGWGRGPYRTCWGRSPKHRQVKSWWGHSWKWLPQNFPHSLHLAGL